MEIWTTGQEDFSANERGYCFEAKVATESRSCRIGGSGVDNLERPVSSGSDLGSTILKYHPPGQPHL